MSSNNTKQVFWISLGNFIALFFTIVSTVVMSRFYNTVNYGTYKQIFWIYSSLTVVFTLGLPRAFGYFLPRVSECEAQSLINKITKIFFILGATFSCSIFLLSDVVANALNNQDLSLGLKLFSPVPFFLIPTMGIDSIYATINKTQISALYNIINKGLLATLLILSSILWSFSYIYAILAFNFASFISFIFALYLKKRPYKRIQSLQTSISIREILAFSLPIMGANILNVIINSADPFFVSRFFGVTEFAMFSNGAMELPFIGMIIGACSVVLLPIYSRLRKNQNDIESRHEIVLLWRKVIEKSVMLIYPIIIFCLVFAYEIMIGLYGSKYEGSGLFFRIMLFNNFFSIISTYPLILALNKVKSYMKIYFVNCLILLAMESFSILLFKNVYIICIISVFCLALRNICFIKLIATTLHIKTISLIPIKLILQVIGISVFSTLAVKVVMYNQLSSPNIIVSLVCAFVLSGLIYLTISASLKIDYINIIKPLIAKRLK